MFSVTDGVEYVDTGVAVVQATVVVGRHFQLVVVSDFEKSTLGVVLIVHHKVSFNHLIVSHLRKFSPALQVSEGHCCISKKATAILIS